MSFSREGHIDVVLGQLKGLNEPFAFECERSDGEPIEGGASWTMRGVRQRQCKFFEEVIDGKVHKMTHNHKVPRALYQQAHLSRYLPVNPNQPNLAELRRLAQDGHPLPVPTQPDRDWRDGQPLKEMR